jgi:hypothetical protein
MIKVTESNRIKAIGQFLAFYESDLNYIKRFQEFKDNADFRFLNEGEYSFTSFIAEFRIARNISLNTRKEALKLVKKWCKSSSCDDVDGLSQKFKLTKYSHDKGPLSFSSKILFLNNPYNILPLDRYGKKTLGLKYGASYQDYITAVDVFKEENKYLLNKSLNQIKDMVITVEKGFAELSQIEGIRYNRFTDKLLWVCGK